MTEKQRHVFGAIVLSGIVNYFYVSLAWNNSSPFKTVLLGVIVIGIPFFVFLYLFIDHLENKKDNIIPLLFWATYFITSILFLSNMFQKTPCSRTTNVITGEMNGTAIWFNKYIYFSTSASIFNLQYVV